uniref:Uncharacterized protein n=1 Tax=Haptolina brevifila TaxID=156173 RepID=A0A7S2HZ83_9EUKA
MSQSPRVASRAAPSPTHLDKTRTVESFSSLDAADTAAAQGLSHGRRLRLCHCPPLDRSLALVCDQVIAFMNAEWKLNGTWAPSMHSLTRKWFAICCGTW